MIDRLWYSSNPLSKLLLPLSWVYLAINNLRRSYLVNFRQIKPEVPLLVVGNITVGGTGKTPLVIALAEYFKRKGLRVGIVSRGYRAKMRNFPHLITATDTAEKVGDEPYLLFHKTQCPVVISPDRCLAVKVLLNQCGSQLILSDDGLQHYRMGRTVEIAVMDGLRRLGNGYALPAGPLREPKSRLEKVHLKVINEGEKPGYYTMSLQPDSIINLQTGQKVEINQLPQPIAAIAGIGNPERFFLTLNKMGIAHTPYAFPDHHRYKESDLSVQESCLLMTEKDAVKCKGLTDKPVYYLQIKASLDDEFWQAIKGIVRS